MSEGLFTRVYMVLMCINIALIVFGGVTVYKNQNNPGEGEFNMTSVVTTPSYTNVDAIWGWISLGFDFVLLGGIVGMFSQAGMPVEVQMMFGVPITALAIYAMYPIIKAVASAIGGAIGGVLGIIARIV